VTVATIIFLKLPQKDSSFSAIDRTIAPAYNTCSLALKELRKQFTTLLANNQVGRYFKPGELGGQYACHVSALFFNFIGIG
jgi:hypothetical protein